MRRWLTNICSFTAAFYPCDAVVWRHRSMAKVFGLMLENYTYLTQLRLVAPDHGNKSKIPEIILYFQ
jgi:hypothetical protein